jgi:hypothetical protein
LQKEPATNQPSPAGGTSTATKDLWDKIEASSGLLQGLAVALIGAAAGYLLNRAQLRAQANKDQWERQAREAEVTVKLIPHLISVNDAERRLAFRTLSQLGSGELASDLSAQFDEVGDFGLRTVEDKLLAGFSEEMMVTYVISPDDMTPDLVRVDAVTTSVGPDALRWRSIEVGATSGSEQQPSFDAVDFRVASEGSGAFLTFEPIVESPDRGLVGRVIFDPQIQVGQSLRWGYRYAWKGLWRQLRETGSDEGSYGVERGISRLTFRWEFPPSCSNIRFRCEPDDEGGPVMITTASGPTLVWNLDKPRGLFSYWVDVDWA